MIEIGKKYNRLTCIRKDENRDSRYYIFKCECGNEKSIIAGNVERGFSKSCGCYEIEHPSHYKYGYSHTRIDNIYRSMKTRCYIKTNKNYKKYGGRGIKICDEWLKDKMSFFSWAFENGYNDNLTIDRINTNGNYEPQNCRWVTYKEQARNTRKTKFVKYDNKYIPYQEYKEITGMSDSQILKQIKEHKLETIKGADKVYNLLNTKQ